MFTVCSRKIDVFFVNSVFAVVQCLAHNLKVVGSNPTPATNLRRPGHTSGPLFSGFAAYRHSDPLTRQNTVSARKIGAKNPNNHPNIRPNKPVKKDRGKKQPSSSSMR